VAKRISKRQLTALKAIVFIASVLPFSCIMWDALNELLGADPIQTLHFRTGDWALRFLLTTLAMSPLQRVFNSPLPIRFRRMLGLFTFFYASLHFAVWLVLDQSLSLDNMLEDVPESPYIILGLLAYSMLCALAVTSTAGIMQRMGKSWFTLHKLVYLIAIMGVVHFFWLTKLDYAEPIVYAMLLSVLLAFRWHIIKGIFMPKERMS